MKSREKRKGLKGNLSVYDEFNNKQSLSGRETSLKKDQVRQKSVKKVPTKCKNKIKESISAGKNQSSFSLSEKNIKENIPNQLPKIMKKKQ